MMLQRKNIVITGGAGFIGAHLARALAEDNRVTIFDNLSTGSREAAADLLDANRATLITGDIRDLHGLDAVFNDADLVFHLAVLNLRACMTDADGAESVNVRGTLNAARAAQKAGAARFVYVSSSDIYGDVDEFPTPESCNPRPTTIYGATKLAGELVCDALRRANGFPALVVRPFNAYGPGEHAAGDSGEALPRFIVYALAGRPLPVYGSGAQTRSFTHISDTVRGMIAAASLESIPDFPLNIASAREVSIMDAARAVLHALNLPDHPIEHLPQRPGDMARQCADVSRMRALAGFSADITLEQGLPSLIDYLRSSAPDPESAPRLWPGS
jgi:UDP-glucose 4-epimerase